MEQIANLSDYQKHNIFFLKESIHTTGGTKTSMEDTFWAIQANKGLDDEKIRKKWELEKEDWVG